MFVFLSYCRLGLKYSSSISCISLQFLIFYEQQNFYFHNLFYHPSHQNLYQIILSCFAEGVSVFDLVLITLHVSQYSQYSQHQHVQTYDIFRLQCSLCVMLFMFISTFIVYRNYLFSIPSDIHFF